jgi:hypothetical protein
MKDFEFVKEQTFRVCLGQLQKRYKQYVTYCFKSFCSTTMADPVLLSGIQLTYLYFVIHYCCDITRKVRALNARRHLGAPYMYWPHEK